MLDGNNSVLIWRQAGAVNKHKRLVPVDRDKIITAPNWEVHWGRSPQTEIDIQAMRDEIARIAPWVSEVWLVPALHDLQDSKNFSGFFYLKYNQIVVAYSGRSFSYVFSTLYHELFHAVQAEMSANFERNFYEEIESRPLIRYSDTYLDDPSERSARQFEHFAMLLAEGVSISHVIGQDRIFDLFSSIYNGDFAKSRAAAIAEALAEQDRQNKKAARVAALKSAFGFKKAA
jgi:hypothetical protein